MTVDGPGAATAADARTFNWSAAVMVSYLLWRHLVELVVDGFTDEPVSVDAILVVLSVAVALVVGLRYRPTIHWALVAIWFVLMTGGLAAMSALV